jgi:hypothetical protein
MNGIEFEKYVEGVYRTLLNLRGENIQVSSRTKFFINDKESYEIDVFYEFYKAGVRHRVAIECKDWKKPVSQGEVLEFSKKIKNIGQDVVGVIVSKLGFQSGAVSVAQRDNILTLTGDDLPSLPSLVGQRILAVAIHEPGLIGEPFWVIAELADAPHGTSTGVYFAMNRPNGAPEVPLFFSRTVATRMWEGLPEKDHFGVFGLPQYKLKALLNFLSLGNQRAAICLDIAADSGPNQILAISTDVESLRKEYLLIN